MRPTALKRFPLHPTHPERNCWGCDLYCSSKSMACGNGADRTQHPVELFGDDWAEIGQDPYAASAAVSAHADLSACRTARRPA